MLVWPCELAKHIGAVHAAACSYRRASTRRVAGAGCTGLFRVAGGHEMEFRILGSLEVYDDGGPVELPAAKQRALLAILLLRANEPATSDLLIDELWGGRPPDSARKLVQTYVSRLRRVLGDAVLVTHP